MQWRANLYFDMPNFRRRISNCRISLNVNLQATGQCDFSRSLVLTFTSCSPNKPVNTCLPSKFSTHSIGIVISIVSSFQFSILQFLINLLCWVFGAFNLVIYYHCITKGLHGVNLASIAAVAFDWFLIFHAGVLVEYAAPEAVRPEG